MELVFLEAMSKHTGEWEGGWESIMDADCI